MMIRIADVNDLAVLGAYDHHIVPDNLALCIGQKRVLIAELNGIFTGWLRYGLFWDNTPFMNMLLVLDGYRGRGFGRALVAAWEARMRREGYRSVLTSTLASEEGQHFYRSLGYRDVGVLLLPGEPAGEIILHKAL